MTGRLAGRVAIITGAARGQGAAEAELFVDEGAEVLLADVDLGACRALAEELGPAAAAVALDVRDESAWADAIATCRAALGEPTILVNNAGTMPVGALEDGDVDTFRAALDVNVVGALLGIRAVIGPMRAAGGGSIVNVSSIAGTRGVAGLAGYSSSKWALRGLSRSAALELGHDGIRVNAVLPGPIDTDLIAAFRDPATLVDRPIPRYGRGGPLPRVGRRLLRDRRRVRGRRRRPGLSDTVPERIQARPVRRPGGYSQAASGVVGAASTVTIRPSGSTISSHARNPLARASATVVPGAGW